MLTIPDIRNAVEKIAPEYPIKQVQLFGSYAAGLASATSDVDMIVEFSEWPISLWTYCGFQRKLSEQLGINVDIIRYPLSDDVLDGIEFHNVVHLYG